ncbi:LLM class flavin-dependent oxidoreductase [Nocardia gipuzkoensis]|uniref:LLM class flavin-dependent oxidoreductase n=1 Tax=Nocardia gipuzkoensis TaxID=2749991 RepID=UPI00237D5716|nr:LLM class flavin-dependent oxidoreductase [Nocardia gipuzkoensis]MDE1674868.1 LLM class flavin-dependent oxidoreductase [Nocardia gipuzkoensis]
MNAADGVASPVDAGVKPRRGLQVGISIGWSPREKLSSLVSLVASAEAAGIAACWVIDSQLAMKDAYVALAVLANETTHLQLGTGVTNLLTRHETVVANSFASLASIAPGRMLLGVGAGDSAAFPLGFTPTPVRALETGVERVRALLAGHEVEGPVAPMRLSHRTESLPVYVAASQPRMLRMAGRCADGVIIMGPADPQMVAVQMAHIDEGALEAGRDPREIFRDLWVTMAVGDGLDAAKAIKSWASAQARWLTRWKALPSSLERYRAEMTLAADTYDFGQHLAVSADHASEISDEFALTLGVAGTVAECRQRLSDLASQGANRISVSLLSGGRRERLESLIEVFGGIDGMETSK